ncbi:MAG: hypothetical protein H7257_11335 [Taibaiella sp.]|nr:hypothetical protein [Taibaiella sp.]
MPQQDIKTKLDELDTLSAGVVFEREEAWDKLQERLDRKPERKMLPWYRLVAAAALLLLLAGGWLRYRKQSAAMPEIAQKMLPKQQNQTNPGTAAMALPAMPTDIAPSAPYESAPNKQDDRRLVNTQALAEKSGITNPGTRHTTFPQEVDTLPAIHRTIQRKEPTGGYELAMVTNERKTYYLPAQRVMPVVHINDLEQEDNDSAEPAAGTGRNKEKKWIIDLEPAPLNFGTASIRNMKIVHVNALMEPAPYTNDEPVERQQHFISISFLAPFSNKLYNR